MNAIMITEQAFVDFVRENMKMLAWEYGLSSVDIAEYANVNRRVVQRCMTGEHIPDLVALHNISVMLDCPIERLIGYGFHVGGYGIDIAPTWKSYGNDGIIDIRKYDYDDPLQYISKNEWRDEISERLRLAMAASGVNWSKVARETGTSRAAYMKYKSGERLPSAAGLLNCCAAMGIRPSTIVSKKDGFVEYQLKMSPRLYYRLKNNVY